MAYSTSNPPELHSQAVAGPRTWVYKSTDAIATVRATGYITNGQDLGMKLNDLVMVTDTTNGIISTARVASLSTSNRSIDLADGTTIGTATDSD